MKNKNSLIMLLVIIILLLILIIGLLLLDNKKGTKVDVKIDNVVKETYKGKDYYIITGDYKGDYYYKEVDFRDYSDEDINNFEDLKKYGEGFDTKKLYSYDEYVEYINKFNLEQKYKDSSKKYFIISYSSLGHPIVKAKVQDVLINNDEVNVYMWEDVDGVTADYMGYILVFPVDKEVVRTRIVLTYTEKEFNNIKKYGKTYDPNIMTEDKPVIYIYPEKEMKVSVKLGREELITTSYPKYNKGWNVIASPDGNLKYNNRNYYSLYWEGKEHDTNIKEDGFVVEGKNTIEFLEEKLSILGLNEREINEFIIYWLPKLESNKYNYIRFETEEEINDYMPINIEPKPDTLIRVVMDYYPLRDKINVKEQVLNNRIRKGYSVIEWGGSLIKNTQ